MDTITISIVTLLVMVLIYFAGVQRGALNEKQKRIQIIADRYHEELNSNSHLAKYLYPNLFLNAGILSLDKEQDIQKVLKMIEKSHIESPFVTYKDLDLKNIRPFLIKFKTDEQ